MGKYNKQKEINKKKYLIRLLKTIHKDVKDKYA